MPCQPQTVGGGRVHCYVLISLISETLSLGAMQPRDKEMPHPQEASLSFSGCKGNSYTEKPRGSLTTDPST